MLNNVQIVEKVRHLGQLMGLRSDAAICDKCKIKNRMVFNGILTAKTTPQLGTLAKFADGLGVSVEDLIYDRTDADVELGKIIKGLTEYEKTELIVYAKTQILKKNDPSEQQKAA